MYLVGRGGGGARLVWLGCTSYSPYTCDGAHAIHQDWVRPRIPQTDLLAGVHFRGLGTAFSEAAMLKGNGTDAASRALSTEIDYPSIG